MAGYTTPGLDYGGATPVDEKYQIDGIPELNKTKNTTDIRGYSVSGVRFPADRTILFGIKSIKEQNLVQLNIDLVQRGVAGDDSWYSKPQKNIL
ncbi:MAG: beta-galactosidase [Polaribacter sp.]|jgi:beta-galactosidase